MANLEKSGSKILDAWSVKLTFSLTVTFYITKTENRTKNLYHSSHTIALSNGTIFAQKSQFFAKKIAVISKRKGVLVLKGIFYETKYVCILMYQISSF